VSSVGETPWAEQEQVEPGGRGPHRQDVLQEFGVLRSQSLDRVIDDYTRSSVLLNVPDELPTEIVTRCIEVLQESLALLL